MKKLTLLLLAGLLAAVSHADDAATAVHNAPFTINGNQTIQLPVTAAGPVPAKSGDVAMLMAGPLLGASKVHKGESDLLWAFAISCPENAIYRKLTVEDVSESTPQVLISANDPKVELVHAQNGASGTMIRVHTGPIPINPQTVPWLYTDGSTSIVFRITLVTDKGASLVMYQPTVYAPQPKQQLRAAVKQVSDSANAAPAATSAK